MPEQNDPQTTADQTTDDKPVTSPDSDLLQKKTSIVQAIRAELKVPDGAPDDAIFDALDRAKDEVEATVQAKLSTQIQTLSKEKEQALADAAQLDDKVTHLEDQVKELRAELDESSGPAASGTSVVLDGEPHVILLKERAKDMVEQFKKRFVEDDATTLVVRKA